MDETILVSIDDHMVEPPDMFQKRVPKKWLDQAPKVVRNEHGADERCGTYPGRLISLGVVPLWDVDLAVAEGIGLV